ncbi:fam-b protein [Plasmodium berghei ANKA]|uniref:Fam-b protein n=1 Tax=Plasmodium berghei (strain Anka) TaxID=5823 RepID=A0A509AKE0_PLABA|nr:fam-b protein [Plasmodium berghei ANKA]VUC55979.1 fam-b protein [Plasmodium berghei ANKA]|eukprot:XP_034421789.1 fam-b protein [Plasmodium berghei ANKA]
MQDASLDINDFYDSSLSILDKYNDGNYDGEENIYTKQIINFHQTNFEYSDTSSKLKDIEDVREFINEITSELEISKKENDNNREYEIAVEQNIDKRLVKKDIDLLISSCENLKELKHSEHILDIDVNNFEKKYNEVISGNNYNIVKCNSKFDETFKRFLKSHALILPVVLLCLISGGFAIPFVILSVHKTGYTINKLFKLIKILKKRSKYKIKKLKTKHVKQPESSIKEPTDGSNNITSGQGTEHHPSAINVKEDIWK